MTAAATTRDKEFRRAPSVVRSGDSSRTRRAHVYGACLMRCLLFCCGLALVNGCAAPPPSAGNTTATATTPVSATRPVTAESAGEVRANGQLSPNAPAGATNSTLATAKDTPGTGSSAQQTASTTPGEQEGGEASAAYEGFYEVLGARPKGFEQFGNFMIRAPQGGRISGAVVPLEGEIYEFARATLADRHLTFETKRVGGVHYSFDGQFLAAPPFASNRKAAVAEGLVRKFQGARPATEARMKFYFDEGGEDP